MCLYKRVITAYTMGLFSKHRKEYIKDSIDLILILEVMNDNRTTSEKLCGCKIKMSISHIDIEKEIEFQKKLHGWPDYFHIIYSITHKDDLYW